MAELIENMNVFWTGVLAFFFLRERIKWYEVAAMFLAFTAIIVIVLTKDNLSASSSSGANAGYVLMLLASWFTAGMGILNRKMADIHWSVIMLVYSYVGIAFSSVYMGVESWIRGSFIIHNPGVYLLLAGVSVIDYFKVTAQVIAF
jgi:drug/metabolite transporter (DMT)-like permease